MLRKIEDDYKGLRAEGAQHAQVPGRLSLMAAPSHFCIAVKSCSCGFREQSAIEARQASIAISSLNRSPIAHSAAVAVLHDRDVVPARDWPHRTESGKQEQGRMGAKMQPCAAELCTFAYDYSRSMMRLAHGERCLGWKYRGTSGNDVLVKRYSAWRPPRRVSFLRSSVSALSPEPVGGYLVYARRLLRVLRLWKRCPQIPSDGHLPLRARCGARPAHIQGLASWHNAVSRAGDVGCCRLCSGPRLVSGCLANSIELAHKCCLVRTSSQAALLCGCCVSV